MGAGDPGQPDGNLEVQSTGLSITINPEIRHQEMTGFGAALSWYLSSVYRNNAARDAAIEKAMFEDLGLDILRLKNWYYPDDADGESAMRSHNINNRLFHAAKAANPDIQVLYSSWSPPDALKSNGERRNGGTLKRDADGNFMYAAFADYWVEVLDNLGWTPDYLSFQNEPGWVATWETCVFEPTETSTRAGYAEAADAIWEAIKDRPDVPKMIGSEAENMPAFFRLNQPLLSRPYIAVHAYHVYDIGNPNQIDSSTTINRLRRIRDEFGDRPNWQTEFSREFNWIDAARVIHNTLVEANAAAYVYWKMFWGRDTPESMIEHVDNTSFQINPPYYSIKHYSRHIHKGYERIEVSGSDSNVRVSGFLSPDRNRITLVAINRATSQRSVSLVNNHFEVGAIKGYQSVLDDFFQTMEGLDAESPIPLPASSLTTLVLTRAGALDPLKVTPDANGGTPPVPSELEVIFGAPYGPLPATERPGFTFVGWFTEPSGGDLVTEDTVVAIASDHTLYARWNRPPVVDAGADQALALTETAPWTPAALHPAAWYDAGDVDSLTLVDGAVAAWNDKSGNENHALQDTAQHRPTFGTASIGGQDVVSFRLAEQQFLGAADHPSLNLDATGGVNIFSVLTFGDFVNHGSGLNSALSKGGLTDAAESYGIRVGASSLRFKAGSDAPVSTTVQDGTTLLFSGVRRDSEIRAEYYIDGSLRNSRTNPHPMLSDNTDPLLIGTDPGSNRHANVDFGEILILGGELSTAERQRIEGYLAHKWGLAAGLPAGHPHKDAAPVIRTVTALLQGSASDPDGDPLTTEWTLTEGPAAVVFADPFDAQTTVTFTAPGIYTLRLTASDEHDSAFDECVITVAQSIYEAWAGGHGLTGDDADPYFDPMGGNLANLLRFAFDVGPLAGRPGPIVFIPGGTVESPGLPVILPFASAQGSPPFQAVFGRRLDALAAGLTYTVEFSADLLVWTANGGEPAVLSGPEPNHSVEAVGVAFPASVPAIANGSQPPQFFRIVVFLE